MPMICDKVLKSDIKMESLLAKAKKFNDVYIYGFGISGKWLSQQLTRSGIRVTSFVESDVKKEGFEYEGIMVQSYKKLCHDFAQSTLQKNQRLIINSVVDIQDLWNNLSNSPYFTQESLGIHLNGNILTNPIDDATANYVLYSLMAVKSSHTSYFDDETIFLRSVDLQITERCSMKCQDCSNLMQYYEKPVNIPTEKLVNDLEKLLASLDHLFEVRLIGGEPFVHPNAYDLIEYCSNLEKVSYVSIFTNSTLRLDRDKLLSKNINLANVSFQVTNYGGVHERKLAFNIQLLDDLGLHYRVHEPEWWTDSGTILTNPHSLTEAKRLFSECCGKNLFTISDGKIYRCPFASNADRLNAIPKSLSNYADLDSSTDSILDHLGDIEYIPACMYCKGRSWDSPTIQPAIQTRKPLTYNKLTSS